MKKTEQDIQNLLISKKGEFATLKDILNLRDDEFLVMAGPCSVENYSMFENTAIFLKKIGVSCIRGGAYKPRTSPYDFQGLREEGLKILKDVSARHNLKTITEVVDTRQVQLVLKYSDILQIGSRNMHNYELLKEVGRSNCPVMLKRGFGATIKEFMLAAEYIAMQGNRKIILCERGIRTFETKTRNTLDISCIPLIKLETGLPIIVDLSHSLGRKDIACPIAKAVKASGADGIMVEVHPNPEEALSDNKQQMNFDEFSILMNELRLGTCQNIIRN